MLKRLFLMLLIIGSIIAVTVAIIAFGRGYRFNPGTKSVTSTGVLSVSSYPDGASIFINGQLRSATNTSINIDHGHYNIKITKEGYIPWEKKIVVQGEIVTKVDALLLPVNPSLRPLTSGGVVSPILSSTNTQLSYIVPLEATPASNLKNKGGIWLWNIKESPLTPFGNTPRLLARSTNTLDFTRSHLLWSTDERQILAVFFKDDQVDEDTITAVYQLDTETTEQVPILATYNLKNILSDWKVQDSEKNLTILSSLPIGLSNFLENTATGLDFSADENKLMYTATATATLPLIIKPPLIGSNSAPEERTLIPGTTYIYDLKEDKNFKIIANNPPSPTPSPKGRNPIVVLEESPQSILLQLFAKNHKILRWYSDSKHIVMIENNTIYIEEYDGQNKTTIYAGPFEDSYIFPWPGGGRILILTNYNKAASIYPNLFAVDLR